MHHLGIGTRHRGTQILAIADDHTITVIALATGEILSTHQIEPEKSYWRNTQRSPGRWPGLPVGKSRLRCHLCRDSTHGGRRGTRTPDILLVREALYQLSYASEAPQEYAIRGGPEKPGRKWKLSR